MQIDQEHEFSTSQASFLGDILGGENIRRLSAVSNHVQTTSSSDQCFFLLIIISSVYFVHWNFNFYYNINLSCMDVLVGNIFNYCKPDLKKRFLFH